jgi:CDP-glucose 4,6-dehydratase
MKDKRLADFYRDKKILVTGHTGFKGAWLAQVFLVWGAKVSGYALAPNTKPNLYGALGLGDHLEHIQADIRDYQKLNRIVRRVKPDIIFHLAAQPLVRDSYDDPLYTYETNVMGTANVLEAMRQNGISAGVIVTTDKVYKNFERDIAYKEDHQLGGHDPYSNSKACADLVTDSYIKSFFDPKQYGKSHHSMVASARAGNVIGGGDWARDRLMPDAIRAFLAHNKDLIIRSPRAIRPWQHVFEPLHGYLLLAKHLHESNGDMVGAWNFGPHDDDMQSVERVLGLVIGHLGKGKYAVQEDGTKHEATNLKLDNTKARDVLGWKPKYNLDKAVRETVVWYREFYGNKSDIKKFSRDAINQYFK